MNFLEAFLDPCSAEDSIHDKLYPAFSGVVEHALAVEATSVPETGLACLSLANGLSVLGFSKLATWLRLPKLVVEGSQTGFVCLGLVNCFCVLRLHETVLCACTFQTKALFSWA